MLLPFCALLGYWLLLIHQLGAQWSVYAQYSYGWAVPVLCAYLFWQKLRAGEQVTSNIEHRTSNIESGIGHTGEDTESTPHPKPSPPAPLPSDGRGWRRTLPDRGREGTGFSWLPLLLLLACALLYAPTRLVHEANPIWRLTSWLWTLEVIALTLGALYLLGGGRWLRRLAFPVAFFVVAVPWPTIAERTMVDTLTGLNVTATIELLTAFGIPALQHGNVIEISTGVVGVDEACSGIRSFQATLMISLFFGELYSLTALRRVLCVLLGFALSFIFNVGRTFLLTYVASNQGVPAIDKWHDPAGVTVLVWCFVALWLAALMLKREGKDKERPGGRETSNIEHRTSNIESVDKSAHSKVTAPLTPSLSPSDGERVVARPGEGAPSPDSALQPADSEPKRLNFRLETSDFRLRAVALGLIAWLVLVELGVQFWYRSHERTPKGQANWALRVADPDSSFRQIETPATVLSQFNADENTELRWQDEGASWQLYYFRWHPASSLKKRVSVQMAKTHGPEKCLPAAGIKVKSYLGIKTVTVAGLKLALQHYLFEAQGKPLHVFYAIYEDPTGTEELANRRRDFKSRVAAARAGSRNYGQRFLELAVWGIADQQQAEAALQRQLERIIRVKP